MNCKEDRSVACDFWSYNVCPANRVSDQALLFSYSPFIISALAVILVARAVSVHPIVSLANIPGEKIPRSWTRILAIRGLRGVISAALAFSLPDSFPFSSSLILQGESFVFYLKKSHSPACRKRAKLDYLPQPTQLRNFSLTYFMKDEYRRKHNLSSPWRREVESNVKLALY